MHYTVDYSKIADLKERQENAIKDIVDFIGKHNFDKIEEAVKDEKPNRKSFIMQLGVFVGVSGYPAEAWADRLGLQ